MESNKGEEADMSQRKSQGAQGVVSIGSGGGGDKSSKELMDVLVRYFRRGRP